MVARRYRVKGRVQQVGYRAFTCWAAETHGLAGWVRNLPDGSVEAHAEGPVIALRYFEAELRRGPFGGRVDAVEVSEAEPTGAEGFRVVHGGGW